MKTTLAGEFAEVDNLRHHSVWHLWARHHQEKWRPTMPLWPRGLRSFFNHPDKEAVKAPIRVSEHSRVRTPGATFAVDSVTPAEKPLSTEILAKYLDRHLERKIFILPGGRECVVGEVNLYGKRCHPFIDAVHTAFSQHRPLSISPDDIWLLIAQGFGHHVAENAESLRPQLVRHEGKKELKVKSDGLTLASFEAAIGDFSSLIREEINPVLHETLICDFSTTSQAIRTASEVALMDSFSSYFTYSFSCICGIPRITIEGTSDDWQRIRARVEVLATYGLEWWVARLRPILDQFVLASAGRAATDFWQAIYKPVDSYGAKVATGWITDLFPYLGDAPGRCKNHVFNNERHGWALSLGEGVRTENSIFDPLGKSGVSLNSFPSGLSSARLKVIFEDGSDKEVDLVAGFLAMSQNPSDLTLSPLISWCVAELPPKAANG